jgi:hypothetical protein
MVLGQVADQRTHAGAELHGEMGRGRPDEIVHVVNSGFARHGATLALTEHEELARVVGQIAVQ